MNINVYDLLREESRRIREEVARLDWNAPGRGTALDAAEAYARAADLVERGDALSEASRRAAEKAARKAAPSQRTLGDAP